MSIKKPRTVRDHVHKVLPEDYNTNVDNFKILLTIFKVLCNQYPEITPYVSQLEDIISKMRYVEYNEYGTAEDINRLIDAWKCVEKINDVVCPPYVKERDEDEIPYIWGYTFC